MEDERSLVEVIGDETDQIAEPPPKPYHRWRANEDGDFPVRADYCLACGVKRWPPRDEEAQAIAAGPCPKAEDREALAVVPAHFNDVTGRFCTRGGELTPRGRCPEGCSHADHYANDGHPMCEDKSGEPR